MLDILAIVGPIFLIIALGYTCVRSGLFPRQDMRVLGAFVINIALPAVLFRALLQRSFGEVMDANYVAAYLAGSLLVFLLALGAARYLLKKNAQGCALVGMGAAMSNSAFVGFPVALQLFGETAGVALALCMLVENLLLLPFVIALAESSGSQGASLRSVLGQTFLRMMKNPIVIAIVLGFAGSLSGLRLGGVPAKAVDMLATASAPVALFVIGGGLVGQKVRGMVGDLAAISLGKLVLHPLAVAAFVLVFPPADPALRTAAVVFAAAPMLTIYPIFGQKYGQEGMCSAALVVATLLSFITLSVVLGFIA